MLRILNILNELEKESSRNKKEEILLREKRKSNHQLLKVFQYALNPYIVYHIKKIPEYQKYTSGSITLMSALKKLSVITERQKTGQAAIEFLRGIFLTLEDTDSEVLERIIKKDMRCGVGAKTINKIWPDAIPEYPIMKCEPATERMLLNINYPAFAQQKMDGMRVNFHIENGAVDVRSGNGLMINIMGIFDKELLANFGNIQGGLVLDGEMFVLDTKGKKFLPRKKGNGIINKAIKGTISEAEIQRIVVVFWDSINMGDFKKGRFDFPYHQRLKWLQQNLKISNRVKLIDTLEVDSFYEAKQYYTSIVNNGGEGIIIKNKNSIWENKRSNQHIKIKAEHEIDLKIIDVIEGEGKYKGKLGSLLVSTNDGGLEVNVGSGFIDEERDKYFDRDLIGSIATIKYNEIIEKENSDTKSLFLPIFVELRLDKDIADNVK
jgi:hypothetical protein